ncbi:hypothetical protein ACSSS7_003849 [Eimeria intestinalis]
MASRLPDLVLECQEACDKLVASLDALKAAAGEDASVQEALLGACRRDSSECAAAVGLTTTLHEAVSSLSPSCGFDAARSLLIWTCLTMRLYSFECSAFPHPQLGVQGWLLRQLQLHAHLASPEDAAAVQLQQTKKWGALMIETEAAERRVLLSTSGGQRERLLSLHHKDADSHAQLERARMLAFETERFGFRVATDLATQRQTIQRARTRGGDVWLTLRQARLSLRRMVRAARRRRWLLSSFGLVIAGCLFYVLVFRTLWRLTRSSSNTGDPAAAETDAATTAAASALSPVKPVAYRVPADVSLDALEQLEHQQQALLLQQEQQQQHQQPPPLTGRDKFNILQRAAREKRHQQELQEQQKDQQHQQLQDQRVQQHQQPQQQQVQHASATLQPSQGQDTEQQAQHLQQQPLPEQQQLPDQQPAPLLARQQIRHQGAASPPQDQQQQQNVHLQPAQLEPWSEVPPQQEPSQRLHLPQPQVPAQRLQLQQQQLQEKQQLLEQQQQVQQQQQLQLQQPQLSQQQPQQPGFEQPAQLQPQSLSPQLQPHQQQHPGQQQQTPHEQPVQQQHQQQQQPEELQQVAAAAERHQVESTNPNP